MSLLEVSFGVATEDFEEANSWIEAVTGLKGKGRESFHRGGEFYYYKNSLNEEVYLCSNADLEFPEEAVTGAPLEWRIAMDVVATDENSAMLKALDSEPNKFVRIA